MTISNKERFLGIARFERPDDLLMLHPLPNDFFPRLVKEWVEEQGAPKEMYDPQFQRDYFGFAFVDWIFDIKTSIYTTEGLKAGGINIPQFTFSVVPPFESRVLEEDERTITFMNAMGNKQRVLKNDPDVMPEYLDWPVKDRATWKEYKKRLDPNTPERWPEPWDEYVKKVNESPAPTIFQVGSFFGIIRLWMGYEQTIYTFYDDPDLIEDMMDTMCHLEVECVHRALKDIKVTSAMFFEDMAYKAGPMLSPDMVRKFMVPRYKKVVDALRSHGVEVIGVDSDGNTNELIPIWLDCGMNIVYFLECASNMDAVAVRKKYGKDLILMGGLDKLALLKGKEAIREEVMSKVPFLLESGGYFPGADHRVPVGVKLDDYVYFINLLREIFGLDKLPT